MGKRTKSSSNELVRLLKAIGGVSNIVTVIPSHILREARRHTKIFDKPFLLESLKDCHQFSLVNPECMGMHAFTSYIAIGIIISNILSVAQQLGPSQEDFVLNIMNVWEYSSNSRKGKWSFSSPDANNTIDVIEFLESCFLTREITGIQAVMIYVLLNKSLHHASREKLMDIYVSELNSTEEAYDTLIDRIVNSTHLPGVSVIEGMPCVEEEIATYQNRDVKVYPIYEKLKAGSPTSVAMPVEDECNNDTEYWTAEITANIGLKLANGRSI